METNYKSYDVDKSTVRIDAILNENNSSFQELKSIPERSKLTFTNGFYVYVGALFIDLRGSSKLTGDHRRPRLAKLYRSYLSECVAILNSHSNCKEIDIVGDCVSGIFEAEYKHQIDEMINAAAQINSLIKMLNYKFKKKGLVEVKAGIGISYGRALMIKAGYSGSTINEVVWMGDVVNQASNLCNKANKDEANVFTTTPPILIDEKVYENLNDVNKNFFSKPLLSDYYGANIINLAMEEWYNENCK